MGFSIRFSEEKNQLLKATRNISFEEILDAIENDLLADLAHPGLKRAQQRIFVVRVKEYAYAVPYIINVELDEIFLKTIYPSRALTKLYIKERGTK
jgi:hypothetical protein